MKLRDVLPKEALSGEYEGAKFLKYLDCEVVQQLNRERHPIYGFPFTHANINVWWIIEDRRAVGWNENPKRGWSFPVAKLPKITKVTEGFTITVNCICPECNRASDHNVDKHDFYARDDSCELCGSHGEIYIDIRCPLCKHFFEIEINSW